MRAFDSQKKHEWCLRPAAELLNAVGPNTHSIGTSGFSLRKGDAMPDWKEGYFGGLPEDVFAGSVVFLQGVAGGGTAAAGAALSALVSLAQSEHAAAASTYQVRSIDAVFRAIELKADLEALKVAPAAGLPAALAAFKGKLDNLANFWYGK